jgi:hypothetical protein
VTAPLLSPKVYKRRDGRSRQGVLCWALVLLGIGLGKRCKGSSLTPFLPAPVTPSLWASMSFMKMQ